MNGLHLSKALSSSTISCIHSNFRTWMYGKGGTEPGWRITAGCVISSANQIEIAGTSLCRRTVLSVHSLSPQLTLLSASCAKLKYHPQKKTFSIEKTPKISYNHTGI